jgi:hypothetical protein
MELFRLIRSLPSQSTDKNGVMGELCRITRHLGSGIQRAGSFAIRQSKTILARQIELKKETMRERIRVIGVPTLISPKPVRIIGVMLCCDWKRTRKTNADANTALRSAARLSVTAGTPVRHLRRPRSW